MFHIFEDEEVFVLLSLILIRKSDTSNIKPIHYPYELLPLITLIYILYKLCY